jgi:hypothetical protein
MTGAWTWHRSMSMEGWGFEVSDIKQSVLTELAEYAVKLNGIENRFKRTTGAVWIGEGDAEHLLQYVRELIDLLDAVLGKPNQYSRQISAYYGNGLQNMYGSPSLQSVREINAFMKAIQTHIARPTTVLAQNEGEEVREMEYDVMEVCLNGHKITGCLKSQPFRHENFCNTCGAETTSKCGSCDAVIRGDRHTRGGPISRSVPHYCINCGATYPWQTAAIENFKEIVRESDLSSEDQEVLNKALPDIVSDTPKTESASLKVKRILEKMGKPLYEIAIKVVTDVGSETAKKILCLK